ncbi:Do/DeqQ family serine protease [Catalinimonas alkaloidigena]|uniref:Do/DeqQ family serine protease n=1 Tax=Catalinimonas alkaloidigena TaxID=1075417 RepID=A0A1G9DSF5_9BACT|nr:trypsin-like peptidase domain-containing protein [Catalinimonas alkaloidigena]SDK66772.1 Do/DeqQ family serine protease [Catalinimonas alkaloidigena]
MTQGKFFAGVLLAALLGAIIAIGAERLFAPRSNTIVSLGGGDARQWESYLSDSNAAVPEGLNFVVAANMVRQAVVHITTSSGGTQRNRYGDILQDFLGEGDAYHGQNLPREASGSGVIIADDGYIVTNHHVIDEARTIHVVLDDKRSYEAELIGSDPTTDLALLKIDAADLPTVKYGDSDRLQIGEWVLAVGNPFDLTSTVTAGIVSAKGRNINILRTRNNNYAIESFIQTDAAVNPGNSGGALVDLQGRLIGINTAIATTTGSYSGYSFAVPVAIVQKVMDDLLNYGEVRRALLGVSITEMSAERALNMGIDRVKGVYIEGVTERSAAAEASLQKGDVVLEIDGIEVNSPSELQEVVARYHPGDEVEVTYLRGQDIAKVSTVLKSVEESGLTPPVRRTVLKVPSLGASLQAVSAKEMQDLKLTGGVKVVQIEGDGKMDEAGIDEGFIITAIDKEPVSSPEQVVELIREQAGGVLIEGLYPDGKKAYYAIGW